MSRSRQRPRDVKADQVLRDLAHGFTQDETAARNGCSERTVRTIQGEHSARLHELRLKYADASALKFLRDIVDGVTQAPMRERVQAANILLKFPIPQDGEDDADGSRTVVGGEIHVSFAKEDIDRANAERKAEVQREQRPADDKREHLREASTT